MNFTQTISLPQYNQILHRSVLIRDEQSYIFKTLTLLLLLSFRLLLRLQKILKHQLQLLLTL